MARLNINHTEENWKKTSKPASYKLRILCYLSLTLNIINLILHFIK